MEIVPEVKSFYCSDLEYRREPDEPDNCSLPIQVDIGIKGGEGADIFSFVAATPKALQNEIGYRWGRGLLILETFSWAQVEDAVEELCADMSGASWEQVARELNRWLHWEYDSYR